MSFWNNLVDAYNANAKAMASTYPLSTTTVSNNTTPFTVITLDVEGNLRDISSIRSTRDNVMVVTIPITERSGARVGGALPHAVFDQFDYIGGDAEKTNAYMAQLSEFCTTLPNDHRVHAVRKFLLEKRAVLEELLNAKLQEIGAGEIKKKDMILFDVQAEGIATKLWEDESLFQYWHEFFCRKRSENEEVFKVVDSITGEEMDCAEYHPKKIVNSFGNAKLVSDNDTTNFTFRGRFATSAQALSIGYESSQKAHQFLRYLVADRGFDCGEGRTLVTYTIPGKDRAGESATAELPKTPLTDKDIFEELFGGDEISPSDLRNELGVQTGIVYSEALSKAVSGGKYGDILGECKHDPACVLILDAATTGRLSVTFYRELMACDYFDRIEKWHQSCKWLLEIMSTANDGTKKRIRYEGAPSAYRIIRAVYGKPRGGGDKSYSKLAKNAYEMIVRCIFDNAMLPGNYLPQAFNRCNNPHGITDKDGKFDRYAFMEQVSVTCALYQKHLKDNNKEVYEMAIELDRTDRDYLYGRLLGAADMLEAYALYKNDKDRETAALRYMQPFSQRPFSTWGTIHNLLIPSKQKVPGCLAEREIGAITGLFRPNDFERDTPLTPAYLLGYYHERNHIIDTLKSINSESAKEGE